MYNNCLNFVYSLRAVGAATALITVEKTVSFIFFFLIKRDFYLKYFRRSSEFCSQYAYNMILSKIVVFTLECM